MIGFPTIEEFLLKTGISEIHEDTEETDWQIQTVGILII